MRPIDTIVDDTLFIDNSRLEAFQTCNRMAHMAVWRSLKPSEPNAALQFGSCIHLALKGRYYGGATSNSEDRRRRCHYIIDKFYEQADPVLGDWRTPAVAKRTLEAYNREHAIEDWKTVTYEGKPVVEQAFAVKLGTIGKIKVVWTGRIDLCIEQQGKIWVVDHKTSSQGGQYITMGYTNSSQFKGYAYAMQKLLNRPVQGALVNLLVTRKPTKTGTQNEFMRPRLFYSPDTLVEWQKNTLHLLSDCLRDVERNYFPMRTTQCITRYGKCRYHEVCALDISSRENLLSSGMFKKDDWTPMRPDEVDVDAIMAMPANKFAPVPEVIQDEEITRPGADILADVMSLIK